MELESRVRSVTEIFARQPEVVGVDLRSDGVVVVSMVATPAVPKHIAGLARLLKEEFEVPIGVRTIPNGAPYNISGGAQLYSRDQPRGVFSPARRS